MLLAWWDSEAEAEDSHVRDMCGVLGKFKGKSTWENVVSNKKECCVMNVVQ